MRGDTVMNLPTPGYGNVEVNNSGASNSGNTSGGFSHSHQFSPLRPWRHRHIAHKTISYRLRGPQTGDLFLLPPQPQGGTSKPQCPHGRVGPRPTPRGRSERRRRKPELPPTLLSVVRPRPCAARPMPPLSSRRRFVYSGAIQCPKASITFRTLL